MAQRTCKKLRIGQLMLAEFFFVRHRNRHSSQKTIYLNKKRTNKGDIMNFEDARKFLASNPSEMVKIPFEPKIIDGKPALYASLISEDYDHCDLEFTITRDKDSYNLNTDINEPNKYYNNLNRMKKN